MPAPACWRDRPACMSPAQGVSCALPSPREGGPMSRTPLPLVPTWNPARAADYHYPPDQQAVANAAAEWRRAHGIRPAAGDKTKVHLLLIDVQKDFCHPEGTLYVGGRSGTGAVDD